MGDNRLSDLMVLNLEKEEAKYLKVLSTEQEVAGNDLLKTAESSVFPSAATTAGAGGARHRLMGLTRKVALPSPSVPPVHCISRTLTLSGWGSLDPKNKPRTRFNGKRHGNGNTELTFGTWNVRTLYKPGAAQSMIKEVEKYGLGVVALQEIRWKEAGSIDMGNMTILFGGCDERRQYGDGFSVRKNIVPTIKDFRIINPRLALLKIETKSFDIVFINVHAPTEDKSQQEKEKFYTEIEQLLEGISNSKIKIVLGDMNAKIGKERSYRPTIGTHSLHEMTNGNGTKLVDIAIGKGLKVKSTMFPHKDIHKGTWVSPDRGTTYRGADCDSDHFLLASNLRVKLKTMSRNMRPEIVMYDVEKLRDSRKAREFQENIQKMAREFNSNPETGEAHRTKKTWFNAICQEALKIRKIARERWLNDANNQEEERIFRVKRKEVHNIFRCENRKHVQNVIREAEQDYRLHNTRQLYHKYFEKLLNCEVPVDTFTYGHNEPNYDPFPPPSKEEIEQQIKRLKSHKSPGKDDLQGEILKHADSSMIESIYLLIKEVWETEILPIDWGVAYICPIHKKGDKQVCSNYRGIALLDTTYKVLSYCILDRIKPLAEQVVGDYQCGFRQNRSTTDQIFIIRQLFQKSWEYNKELHVIFVDFQKAYDRIDRTSITEILKHFHFPRKIVQLVEASIRQTKVKVKVGNATSRMVEVIREINIGRDEGVRMDRTCFSLLAYADDIIVLLGEDEQKVVGLCGRLIESAKKVGLHLNIEKTQYMKVSRELDNHQETETITVGQYEFK
ncbi:uncharacterized protein LOC100575877 [Acyrthosiphon pisum]|uniref:Reverse transcriptase domain-containing protein n=1 Tax=Acyrthosiphon pisum TaxID=7029 RepID=A0A8R2JVF1_ACYPI|nr:uncharacterized protein LOC100575877 [Acyrthosiphon pisum]